MISKRPQPEWLDIRTLRNYACVSDGTNLAGVDPPVFVDALPAVRVGGKILVRRSQFDRWLETHQVSHIDVGGIVDEMITGIKGIG